MFCFRFVFGGNHTKIATSRNLKRWTQDMHESVSAPSKWLSWPTVTYFLPKSMEHYADDLLILGSWDNNVRQEAPKFQDKINTTRRRFVREFGDPEGYRAAKKKQRSSFLKLIQEVFSIKGKVAIPF
jgi:hypothetical protein